ncbi:hypothetical protein J7S78_13255 [Klebsiella oxytoca]|uniref:Uncharacterized protein n=1 Tax=Klebsiella oxytoca TaxID=571 RepID=A0AAP2FJK2_KLEOX|nr:hypothetical protein [Klebsiella oxytoca]MBQ0600760.1 hypothetical protein [Klebsiella oxytoca]
MAFTQRRYFGLKIKDAPLLNIPRERRVFAFFRVSFAAVRAGTIPIIAAVCYCLSAITFITWINVTAALTLNEVIAPGVVIHDVTILPAVVLVSLFKVFLSGFCRHKYLAKISTSGYHAAEQGRKNWCSSLAHKKGRNARPVVKEFYA